MSTSGSRTDARTCPYPRLRSFTRTRSVLNHVYEPLCDEGRAPDLLREYLHVYWHDKRYPDHGRDNGPDAGRVCVHVHALLRGLDLARSLGHLPTVSAIAVDELRDLIHAYPQCLKSGRLRLQRYFTQVHSAGTRRALSPRAMQILLQVVDGKGETLRRLSRRSPGSSTRASVHTADTTTQALRP